MDVRLRELGRQVHGGDPAAQARLLLERTRAGDVAEERLTLAAYAGDAVARLVLGQPPPAPVDDVAFWVGGLEPWGWPALGQAALAGARHVAPLFADARPGDRQVARAVDAAEAWLRAPKPYWDALDAEAEAVHACLRKLDQGLHAHRAARAVVHAVKLLLDVPAMAARDQGARRPAQTSRCAQALATRAVEARLWAVVRSRVGLPPPDGPSESPRRVAAHCVQAAISGGVAAWALTAPPARNPWAARSAQA